MFSIVARLRGLKPIDLKDEARQIQTKNIRIRNFAIFSLLFLLGLSIVGLIVANIQRKNALLEKLAAEKAKEDLEEEKKIKKYFIDELAYLTLTEEEIKADSIQIQLKSNNYLYYFFYDKKILNELIDYMEQISSLKQLKFATEYKNSYRRISIAFSFIVYKNLSQDFIEWINKNANLSIIERDMNMLVENSPSLNQGERKYWYNLIEVMTLEQIAKLVDILGKEAAQLLMIEIRYKNESRANMRYADSLFKAQNFQEALIHFQQVYLDEPLETEALKKIIRIKIEQKDYKEIMNLCEDVIKHDRHTPEPYRFLANVFYSLQDYERSIAFNKEALKLDAFLFSGDKSNILLEIGNGYFRSAYYDDSTHYYTEALFHYLEALKLATETDSSNLSSGQTNELASLLENISDVNQSAIGPAINFIIGNLAMTYFNLGDLYSFDLCNQKEMKLAQKHVERDSQDYRAWWRLGWAYLLNKNYQESLKATNQAITLSIEDPAPGLMANKVSALLLFNQFEEGLSLINHQIEKNKKSLSFEKMMVEDFEELKKYGIVNSDMEKANEFLINKLEESNIFINKKPTINIPSFFDDPSKIRHRANHNIKRANLALSLQESKEPIPQFSFTSNDQQSQCIIFLETFEYSNNMERMETILKNMGCQVFQDTLGGMKRIGINIKYNSIEEVNSMLRYFRRKIDPYAWTSCEDYYPAQQYY